MNRNRRLASAIALLVRHGYTVSLAGATWPQAAAAPQQTLAPAAAGVKDQTAAAAPQGAK